MTTQDDMTSFSSSSFSFLSYKFFFFFLFFICYLREFFFVLFLFDYFFYFRYCFFVTISLGDVVVIILTIIRATLRVSYVFFSSVILEKCVYLFFIFLSIQVNVRFPLSFVMSCVYSRLSDTRVQDTFFIVKSFALCLYFISCAFCTWQK